MSQNQSSYKVIAEGPISIGTALVRKDDILKLTPAVARHYIDFGYIKRTKMPTKKLAEKPADNTDTKTPNKSAERKANK